MPTKWVATLLFLAMVTRIGAALAVGDGFHFPDEAAYVDTAERLSRGGGFGVEYSRVPAYPVFLALLSLGLPASVTFLRVGQAAVAALGTLFVFGLADRMFGRRAAIAAGLVYALDPLLVIASGLLYPEATAAVLLTAIVLIAVGAAERDTMAGSALAGALLGVLVLLRPVALVLPPIVGGWIAVTATARASRRAAHLGALCLTVVLVLAPWTARNYRIHGRLVPPATAGIHTSPVTGEEVAEGGLVVSMSRWAWRNPVALLSRVTRQFAQFWELMPTRMATDDPVKRERFHERDSRLPVRPLFSRRLRDLVSAGTFSIELILALVGVVVVGRTRRGYTLLLLGVIVAFAVGYAIFVAKLRYRIPILPLVFLFSGAGAVTAYQFIRRAADRSR